MECIRSDWKGMILKRPSRLFSKHRDNRVLLGAAHAGLEAKPLGTWPDTLSMYFSPMSPGGVHCQMRNWRLQPIEKGQSTSRADHLVKGCHVVYSSRRRSGFRSNKLLVRVAV